MGILKRLKFVFTHKTDIESLLKKEQQAREEIEFNEQRYHLNLCLKHQQERNRSHFSEANCDYCKLLNAITLNNN